jgi:ectoine hydroxylase
MGVEFDSEGAATRSIDMSQLTQQQLTFYRENGYVFLPDLFPPEEIAVVQREIDRLIAANTDSLIREADGKTIRSILNAHLESDVIDKFCRSARVVEPVMQIVDSPVYIFQSIMNLKRAFDGAQWQWHQDYPTYKIDDKMPEPRGVNAMIFIDKVTEFNGPLMMVPGSQKLVTDIPEIDTSVTTYPHGRYPSIDWMKPSMVGRELVAPKGNPGSTILMDLMTVHGSGANMSPWHRAVMSLTLNSVENKATGTVRGRSICHDYRPIAPVSGRELIAAGRI